MQVLKTLHIGWTIFVRMMIIIHSTLSQCVPYVNIGTPGDIGVSGYVGIGIAAVVVVVFIALICCIIACCSCISKVGSCSCLKGLGNCAGEVCTCCCECAAGIVGCK